MCNYLIKEKQKDPGRKHINFMVSLLVGRKGGENEYYGEAGEGLMLLLKKKKTKRMRGLKLI